MRCGHCPRDPGDGPCKGESVRRLCELALDHPDYRERLAMPDMAAGRERPPAEVVAPTPPGPGAWLAWGLHRVGFREAAGCSCAEDAAEMDRIGPDAVLADLEAWTDRLAAKPQAAHVPGRAIRLAIRLACHAAKRSAR